MVEANPTESPRLSNSETVISRGRPGRFGWYRLTLLTTSSILLILSGTNFTFAVSPLFGEIQTSWPAYAFCWIACIYSALGFAIYFRAEKYEAVRGGLEAANVKAVQGYLLRISSGRGLPPTSVLPCQPPRFSPQYGQVEVFKHYNHPAGAMRIASDLLVEREVAWVDVSTWNKLIARSMARRLLAGQVIYRYALPIMWFMFALSYAAYQPWHGSPETIWRNAFEQSREANRAVSVFQLTKCIGQPSEASNGPGATLINNGCMR